MWLMKKNIDEWKKVLFQEKVLFPLYIVLSIIAFIQVSYVGNCNNFIIFRSSFYHLMRSLPLYLPYPDSYFDIFIYSPGFPILFSPFAILPIFVGIAAWLLFMALFCLYSFKQMPLKGKKPFVFAFLILFDLLNNLQHCQTNPVLLSLMILCWSLLEKDKLMWAALCITICFCIKGYPAIVGLLALYHKKWYRIILYALCWFILIHALMLIFISPAMMLQYYKDWILMITGSGIEEQFSVYGILALFHFATIPEIYILGTALLILTVFFIPYQSGTKDKGQLLAFLLIWMVVFNRAAESPTYLLAMAGVLIWYLKRKTSLYSTTLCWITLLLSSVIPTKLIPYLDKLRYDYYLKVFLCIFVLADMLVYTYREQQMNKMLNKIKSL